MVNPTNEVLLEKINSISKLQELEFCHIRKELNSIKEHLDVVNGSTVENTKHRISQQTVNKIVGAAMVVIATALAYKIFI